MRLDHTTTTFDHGWTVNGFLESGDRELKGFFKAPFTLNREVDDLMPDINVDNGVATVRLVPIVANGALTYGLESSSFDAQVQATGPCGLSFADVCDDIASYKQSVKTELAGHVTGALISDTARLAINLTIAQHVSDHGLSRVDTLDFDAAGNLILGEF
jgi:hypothetical protein